MPFWCRPAGGSVRLCDCADGCLLVHWGVAAGCHRLAACPAVPLAGYHGVQRGRPLLHGIARATVTVETWILSTSLRQSHYSILQFYVMGWQQRKMFQGKYCYHHSVVVLSKAPNYDFFMFKQSWYVIYLNFSCETDTSQLVTGRYSAEFHLGPHKHPGLVLSGTWGIPDCL